MTNDQLVEKLQRVVSYSRTIGPEEHEVLKSAIAAIRTSDDVLAEALPNLSTLSDLLTILVQPKKYADALAKITEQVKAAKDERAAAVAEREALESSHVSLEPKLKAAQVAHDRLLATERQAFEKQVEATQHSLAIRTAAVAALEERVKADAAAVEQTKADLERRLRAVREAAA
jgi:hypothetical protein